MVKRCTLLLAAIALTACSEQPPPPEEETGPVERVQLDPPAEPEERAEPQPDPFSGVELPAIVINEDWLVLEFAEGEYGPEVGIGDGEKFERNYLSQIAPDVDEYLRIEAPDRGLPGLFRTPDGRVSDMFSGNPLVCRAPAHFSTRAVELIDRASNEVISYHTVFVARMAGGEELVVDRERIMRVDRTIPEPPPPEQQVRFPSDEDTKSPDEAEPVDPADLESWEKDDVSVMPVFDHKKEVFGFRTEWARRSVDHEDTAFRLDDLCSREGKLDRAQYEKLRARLAAAVLERIEEDEEDLIATIRVYAQGESVSNKVKDRHTSWIVFLLQIDAVNLLNASGKLGDRKLDITWSTF